MPDAHVSLTRPVLIAAGGTGGHVFPALAVAERLLAADVEVLWVGTEKGIESRLVPAAGIELHTISVSGFRGKQLLQRLVAPFQLLAAIVVVLRLALRRRVSCVFATGGYVSAASGVAAVLSRKPFFLQEQNAVAGTTNRLLAPFANRIFTAYPGLFGGSAKVLLSGNPLREAFSGVALPRDRGVAQREQLKLLVLGGSLGAQRLNEILPAALASLAAAPGDFSGLHIVHQSGERDLETVREHYRALGVDADVRAFIDDMPAALQQADLLVARSGALTCSEICAVGVAAIFIPYPHAIDDHQTANASHLQDAGAALLIPQRELDEQRLAGELRRLASDRKLLLEMAERARGCARGDAADTIAKACLDCRVAAQGGAR